MRLETISTDKAAAAIGPYSQAVRAGELIFCSGQIALDPVSGELVPGDVKAQTERVMESIAAVLAAAGVGFDNVVKSTIFLVEMGDFAAVNEVYGSRFGDHKPARSTVAVRSLPRGALVEIEVVAKA
ncbi:MAG: reactive intermediate/imine deaminase [Deltaproteobacteria bacterium]|nr:reactive intermediate/imine deaminase [Deltaproteobacteria bacterium]